MKQDGWTVESTADAPMRVRAWFESLDDARGYADRFGGSALILREVRENHRDEPSAKEEPAADVKNVDELNDCIEEAIDVVDDVRSSLRSLHMAASDLREMVRTKKAVAA